MKPYCIKCNGTNATRESDIKEKMEDPACSNCGEKDYLAACRALLVILQAPPRNTEGDRQYHLHVRTLKPVPVPVKKGALDSQAVDDKVMPDSAHTAKAAKYPQSLIQDGKSVGNKKSINLNWQCVRFPEPAKSLLKLGVIRKYDCRYIYHRRFSSTMRTYGHMTESELDDGVLLVYGVPSRTF
ncbi:hypothetical protein AVEN_635-1 [Araneus ventricosus]|uniref:Uncharacterized protein n=1 Tax=Araneus ventricosus TaxID=182803 RepID=A0A4Y2EHP0_ARAVE|nr:hypothetical protein AVEN_635-1 [Araneus ventricosus]